MDKVDIVEQHEKKRNTNIAQQSGKSVDIVEHHRKGRHSRSREEIAVIAQQRGRSSHSASLKRDRHSAAALKK